MKYEIIQQKKMRVIRDCNYCVEADIVVMEKG